MKLIAAVLLAAGCDEESNQPLYKDGYRCRIYGTGRPTGTPNCWYETNQILRVTASGECAP
jgi:hypothetical protein